MFGFADLHGQLGLTLFGSAPFPLQTRNASAGMFPFSADVGTGNMRFRAEESRAGIMEKMQYHDGEAWHSARRITGRPMALDEILTAASGVYYSASAAATLSFDVDAGKLFVVLQGEYGRARYCVESVARNLLRFWPSMFPGGMLIRMEPEHGIVDRLIVSTSRTRRTVFHRSRTDRTNS